jgi:transposase InsO family protein
MGSRLIETSRPHTRNISTKESYPSTRSKLGDWHGAPSRSSYWVMKRSSTTAAPQAFNNDAYPSPKDRSYCTKYTRGLAITMQHLEPSLGTPSDKVSTGRPRWPTPPELCALAKGVNSTRDGHTCPLKPCRQYPSPGLFAVWGLDLVGPLQKAPGGFSHLLVAIDKFSKWIEVRPLTSIRSEQAMAFFTNIIHRFGVPNSIITDNGTQFTGKKFLDFCEVHHIRVDWAAVAHPMTNGQVEHANGMLLQGLKLRIYNNLNKFSKRWMKELPSVVWSLRTTPSRATGFSSFFLVYGVEAILPTDLEYGSPRIKAYDDRSNQTSREDSLDQLERLRTWPCYTQRGISSLCDATTPEGFGPKASRWETWYFGCGKTPEGATSLLLPGKGRSSSPRF